MLSAFLIKIFNMSIAAGFVVLAVVLARLVLKRAPKWLRCALWVLVAVRLIIPTLPQSTVSLVPSAETIVIKQIDQSVGQEQNGSTDVQQDPEPFDMPYTSPSSIREIEIHSGIPFINSWAGDEFTKDSSSPAEADTGKKVSFLDVAGYLWLGGLIVMVCYAVVSFAKLRAKVRASVPRDNSVYICDDIDSPFILGVIRPRIYLPSGLSADAEAHVLAHERAHLSRRDQLWKPVGYLLLSIYWFNPLMWLAYVLFCRDIEYACDEKVVGSLNVADRADYSRALLSCSVSRRVIAACPLAFGDVGVKDRVKSALNYKKPAFWVIIAAVLICLVLAVCFLTNPRDKAMQGKVTKWFEDEHYAAGQGRVITLPEYPGVEFRKEGHIYMVKDGKEEVVVHAAFIIKNAYFCDLNGDGKPELCTTCEIGSGLIDERVVVYCPADGSTLELQDRGNFDYMLDERDGKLIVMKRAYERTSSVGEDGLLVMKDGKLIMTALSDGSGKSPTSPPELKVVSDRSSVTVKHSGSSWQKGSWFGGVESIIEDSPGLGNEIFRKGLKVIDAENSSWVALSFSQQPDLLEVYVVDESTLLSQGQIAAVQIGVYDEKMISIPSGETYCIVHAEWAVRKGTGGDAYYYFKTVSSAERETGPKPMTGTAINIDSHNYFIEGTPSKELPLGYNYAGVLNARQAGSAGIEGCLFYKSNGGRSPAVYVYMPMTICREYSENGMISYVMKEEYFYVPWVMSSDEEVVSGNKVMTMDDVIRISATRGTDLAWANLEDYYSIMPYSGRYCRYYFIDGSDFRLCVEGSPPQQDGTGGSIYSALLVHQATHEAIDIRTGDLDAFRGKYRTRNTGSTFHVEYVRSNGPFRFSGENAADGRKDIMLIDSYEEFKKHLINPEELQSGVREGSTASIDDLTARYTEEWFADHQLIVAWLLESSGSTRLKVVDLKQSGSTLTVDIDRLCPEAFTDDMAGWQILIEIDRSVPEDIKLELADIRTASETKPQIMRPRRFRAL